jgi:oligoendopeptidase F
MVRLLKRSEVPEDQTWNLADIFPNQNKHGKQSSTK